MTKFYVAIILLPLMICLDFSILNSQHRAPFTEPYGFSSLPYLQNLDENSVTIMWILNRSSTGWIEYGESEEVVNRAVNSRHGLIDANLPVQKVRLEGLKPDTRYYYRTGSREIVSYYYPVVYGDTIYSPVFSFVTPSGDMEEFSFLAFNDTHDNLNFIEEVLKNEEDVDFVSYLGDIMGHIDHRSDIVSTILQPSANFFASEKPFYFIRGNHEARGAEARALIDYIDNPGGNYYYSFSYGPVFFIALDCGEDKADTNQHYYGLADFDAYRAEQGEWLSQVVKSEEFENSEFQIVLIHWPVHLRSFDHIDAIHRHGRLNTQKHFAHILNDAGIDLLLCGHTHRYQVIRPSEEYEDYYTIVGGGPSYRPPGATYTRVDYYRGRVTATLKTMDGEIIESIRL